MILLRSLVKIRSVKREIVSQSTGTIINLVFSGIAGFFVFYAAGFVLGFILGVLIYPQISISTPLGTVYSTAKTIAMILALSGALIGVRFYWFVKVTPSK